MPKDYVMQGMIADTGGEWQLYKRHHTFAMISDWIFHPFRHLEAGDAAMHHGMDSWTPRITEGFSGLRSGSGVLAAGDADWAAGLAALVAAPAPKLLGPGFGPHAGRVRPSMHISRRIL